MPVSTFTHHKKQPVAAIILLLIASITIAGGFLAAFLWSVKRGQFEDQYSPPRRMLFDDAPAEEPTTNP